jgi:gluconate kinase
MSDYPIRPQTPQAMLHRLPNKPDLSSEGNTKPSKYIILIIASTTVAGKVQIAKSVSSALSCPLFQGDSLHETSAKAASVGAQRRPTGADGDEQAAASGANEARYQRMWLSKMTRTGHLFPEGSRPANEDFSGFGGASSTSTSRRGSSSSVASASSSSDAVVSTSSIANSFMPSGTPTTKYINKPPVFTPSDDEKLRKANPALMVVTHPELEKWHKDSIRKAVGEYAIGVIFVPLYEDEELPVLKPLDPKTMTSFTSLGSFGTAQKAVGATLDEEIVLRVNVEAKVEDLIEDIIDGVREIMNA